MCMHYKPVHVIFKEHVCSCSNRNISFPSDNVTILHIFVDTLSRLSYKHNYTCMGGWIKEPGLQHM